MTEYTFPVSDADTLFIDGDLGISFGRLAEKMIDHGFNGPLDTYEITPIRFKITGCSCHPEASDYEQYLKITLRSNPCPDTVGLSPTILLEEESGAHDTDGE
jgi:hypothetical protein